LARSRPTSGTCRSNRSVQIWQQSVPSGVPRTIVGPAIFRLKSRGLEFDQNGAYMARSIGRGGEHSVSRWGLTGRLLPPLRPSRSQWPHPLGERGRFRQATRPIDLRLAALRSPQCCFLSSPVAKFGDGLRWSRNPVLWGGAHSGVRRRRRVLGCSHQPAASVQCRRT